MANVHIVYTTPKNGAVNPLNMQSITIASGATANNSNAAYNELVATAIGGNSFIAFSNSSNAANASGNPRYYLSQGVATVFRCSPNTSIQVIDG